MANQEILVLQDVRDWMVFLDKKEPWVSMDSQVLMGKRATLVFQAFQDKKEK